MAQREPEAMNSRGNAPRRVLVLTQVYVPDPASVGQHMADAAAALAGRGRTVTVFTADRGYDDPSQRHPRRETIDGVDVRRLPFASFGKGSIFLRLVGGASFVAQATFAALFLRGVDSVLVSTSPPMASLAALIISWIKGARVKFWIMDLNPDQLVALKIVETGSPIARIFDALNRRILKRADDVIVLDRFMAERVNGKLPVQEKLHVIPPWPHDEWLESVPHSANPFRESHGLQGKFVVMYSGNHTPSNPFTTLLRAAERLTHDEDLLFVFVGGGNAKAEVETCRSPNVRSLPYQTLERLKYSLSAADVHLVTMGEELAGVVHPCKVYGAMAVARPILFLGPVDCHVSDLIERHQIGWHIRHDDVEGAVDVLRRIRDTDPAELQAMGRRAQTVVRETLSKDRLCGEFCEVVERPKLDAEPIDVAAPHLGGVGRLGRWVRRCAE